MVNYSEEEELQLALALSASLATSSSQHRAAQPPSRSAAAGGSSNSSGNGGAGHSSTRSPATTARPAHDTHGGGPMRGPYGHPATGPHPGADACGGCGRPFLWGSAQVTALGRKWHPDCLVCGWCHGPLVKGHGTPQQAAVGSDGQPYHVACHKSKFHPRCDVCGEFIPTIVSGAVQFKEVPFWRQKYCVHHVTGQAGVSQCCSCGRLAGAGGPPWVSIGDNRELCLECVSSVVVDTKDAQPLYDDVLAFYRSMGLEHAQRVPMMLVDSPTLHQYSQQEGKEDAAGPIFHVRGLCLATVYRAIPTIVRSTVVRSPHAPRGVEVSRVATPMQGGATTTCSVSAILVMYGLPRLLTGAILAHELMHAWLRMRHVVGLPHQVEEGLCQLMALLWLDQEHARLAGDAMQQKLDSYFAYQIREDTSQVYGDGFRNAYDAFQRGGGGMRGLAAVVNNVLRTGALR